MERDANRDFDSADTIQWRHDASTSWSVRLLWSLGVGTLFAAISIIVLWRVYDLIAQGPNVAQSVFVAFVAAIVVTILAFAASSNAEGQLARLTSGLPIGTPSGTALRRALDAAVGTVVMAGVIVALMAVGRLAAQDAIFGGVGPGPFTGIAALLIPFAIIMVALASFLRSAGALDRDEGTLYLFDPEQAVDLSMINDVSVRYVGESAVLTLSYAQPDGQYVSGPRRLVVPTEVGNEITRVADGR
ncbi:hypothetical protein ACLI4Z_00700 [Natrialbaceae archaeon A-arb3/5]